VYNLVIRCENVIIEIQEQRSLATNQDLLRRRRGKLSPLGARWEKFSQSSVHGIFWLEATPLRGGRQGIGGTAASDGSLDRLTFCGIVARADLGFCVRRESDRRAERKVIKTEV